MKRTIALLLVAVMALSLFACATPEEKILGSWKHQSSVLGVVTETTYTFNEDGTGSKTNVLEVKFTYAITEDKLLITTSVLGIENTEEYAYEFKGEELVLTGEKETLTLQKMN